METWEKLIQAIAHHFKRENAFEKLLKHSLVVFSQLGDAKTADIVSLEKLITDTMDAWED